MKKLLILLFCGVLLGFASFKNLSGYAVKSSKITSKAADATISETLNGVNEGTAIGLINQFESEVYKKQKLPQINFWYSLSVLKKMIAVIRDDKLIGLNADGIRLYFTGDAIGGVNNILFVTTIDDTTNKGNHIDYYTHRSNALFSDLNRYGKLFNRINPHGASLYPEGNPNGNGQGCTERQSANSLEVPVAQAMVKQFADAQTIDTALINTKSVWFPVSVFKEILKDANSDGMRVYIARGTASAADIHRRNRDTFIITSTEKTAGIEVHTDFFFCKTVSSNMSPALDNGSLCPNSCN